MYSSENYHESYFGSKGKDNNPKERAAARAAPKKKKKSKEEKAYVSVRALMRRRCKVCKKKINPGETVCSSCQVVTL